MIRRGVVASILLHGAVLACVQDWGAGTGQRPVAIGVAVVFEPAAAAVAAETPAFQARPAAKRRESRATPVSAVAAEGRQGLSVVAPFEDAAGESETAGKSPLSGLETGLSQQGDASGNALPLSGNPPPVYPVSARRAGREGRAVMRVVVSAEGGCESAQIAVSSGTPSLDEAALAAIRRWRFAPKRVSGGSVATTILVPVTFRLNGDEAGKDGRAL